MVTLYILRWLNFANMYNFSYLFFLSIQFIWNSYRHMAITFLPRRIYLYLGEHFKPYGKNFSPGRKRFYQGEKF